MELVTLVEKYIEQPFPVCNANLCRELVNGRWKILRNENSWDLNCYNTAGYILNNPSLLVKRTQIRVKTESNKIYLEVPSFAYLANFYKKHGLDPYTNGELKKTGASEKLSYAIDLINFVSPVYDCVLYLVRAIKIIKSNSADEDACYSHPDIPFSIFVSICNDTSEVSNLRVAESILHEAMHLNLSLIENVIELVRVGGANEYFSPWRQTFRPPGGIVHGIYVFRIIYDFYKELLTKLDFRKSGERFILNRCNEIKNQINTLHHFKEAAELSLQGKRLVSNLTKIEN